MWRGGWGDVRQNNLFILRMGLIFICSFLLLHYTCDFIFLPFSFTVSLSVHVFSCDCNWYWCLYCFCCNIQHTIFGGSVWLYQAVQLAIALYPWFYLVLMSCIMYWTVCYLTGIFDPDVRQISMLFIDNQISVFCIPCQQNQTSSALGGDLIHDVRYVDHNADRSIWRI